MALDGVKTPDPSQGQIGVPPQTKPVEDKITDGLKQLQQIFGNDLSAVSLFGTSKTGKIEKSDTIDTADGSLKFTLTLELSNPKLSADSKVAADKLASILADGDKGVKKVIYNLFLGGLVGVAMLEAMLGYMKSLTFAKVIESKMWLDVKKAVEDTTHAIMANIEETARQKAIGLIVGAVLSAGTALFNCLGLGAVHMMKGGATTANMQVIQMATSAINTVLTGVMKNLVDAQVTIKTGSLEASKLLAETMNDFQKQIMSKLEGMDRDQQQAFDNFMAALKEWLTALNNAVKSI